jgi:hypothetical protein
MCLIVVCATIVFAISVARVAAQGWLLVAGLGVIAAGIVILIVANLCEKAGGFVDVLLVGLLLLAAGCVAGVAGVRAELV